MGIFVLLIASMPQEVFAASTWNPTLLVNTEAFETIDSGDGATNIELRFGDSFEKIFYNRSTSRFQFSRGITVGGGITATGGLVIRAHMSGSSLNVDRNATVGGTLTVSGAIVNIGTFSNRGTLSGTLLHISTGGAEVHGNVSASGSVRADGDLTINDDQTATDAVMTFGNATTNQTLKYLNAAQKFQFSKGVSVTGTLSGSALNVDRNATVGGSLTATGAIRTKGNLSGATLNVDGAFNWRGQSYTAPTSQSANTFLKTDGNGALTWTSTSVGNGSGDIMSLQPAYPNAVYFASGSTTVGQLTATGGMLSHENVYRWNSSKTAKNDYWIAVRVRVPNNFSSWDPVKPIELRYRTGSGQTIAQGQGSYVTVKMLDTTGANVALTGGANLANAAYTTANIAGPDTAGTFTPKQYFTILVKLAASTTPNGTWFAEAGFLNFNWETTTP